jgi:hypothetical protein
VGVKAVMEALVAVQVVTALVQGQAEVALSRTWFPSPLLAKRRSWASKTNTNFHRREV